MSKTVVFAAAVATLLAGAGACSTPTPRYAIVADPLAAQSASLTPEAALAPEPMALAAPAEPVFETPRAAPLGAVETVVLAQLPPPAEPPTPEATPAPVQEAPSAADATLSHVVGPGDTFFAIARRYGVGPQAVAEVNGLTFGSTLRLGQMLQLPVGARDRGAGAARAGTLQLAQAAAPERAAVIQPEPPVVAPATVTPAPAPAAPAFTPPPARVIPPAPSPATAPVIGPPPPIVATSPTPGVRVATPVESALAGRGLFVWPLRGDLISGFGPKGVGQRSDGVNITAAEGDAVRAAAGGTVVYAGDQVKGGFGKLVLVEHDNRWFTAYAHLSDIKVRMKDRVTQNQTIGSAGRTGSVGSPQLYFEVRHAPGAGERARPVDPLPLLPQ